jgi:PAS domain S-box-containing protein
MSKQFFFVFLFFGLIFCAVNATNKIFAVNAVRTVRIGIYDNKPKVYLDEKGVASGFFPDILNYIAKQENWQLQYVFGTWEEGLARLQKGKIDLMVDVAISEERQKEFDFTNETVMSSWGVILVRKNSTINSFNYLNGKKIAILKSSVYSGGPEGIDQYIKAFGLKVEFIKVDEYATAFDLLNKGEVDAAVVSRISALTYQKNYPEIKQTDMFFNPTELRFALTKGKADNRYLTERLDYWVKKLKDGYGGVYNQLLERHSLAGIGTKEVIPLWVIPAEFAVAIILLLLSFIIVRLIHKRAVSIQELRESEGKFRSRTKELEVLTKSQEETKKALLNVMEDLGEARSMMEFEKVKDEAMLASIGEGLIAVDNHGKILLINKAAEKTLGWKMKEMIDEEIISLPLIDAKGDALPLDKRPTHAALSSGKTTIVNNYFFERKDKTRFPIAIVATPIILKSKIIGAIVIFRDITHEKEIDKAKSEFVSLASHQLRTPLGIIKWYLEALENEDYVNKAPTLVRKYFNEICKSNERVLSLVRDLLSVSRIEQGRVQNNPKAVNIIFLIKEIVEQMQIVASKKKVDLHLTIQDSKMPSINMDILRFREVIENLIGNAIEYTLAGGFVDVTLNKIGDTLSISVKDTGIGISLTDQKNLFTKFFRSEKATGHNPKGSGLGLYVAKSYVEGWGGKISVESRDGKGSTFTINLPISQKKESTKGGDKGEENIGG